MHTCKELNPDTGLALRFPCLPYQTEAIISLHVALCTINIQVGWLYMYKNPFIIPRTWWSTSSLYRCCSNKGRVSQRRQKVYIHDSCISDGTLKDVVGTLIGVTPQGYQSRVSSNHTSVQQNSDGNSCPREGSPGECILTTCVYNYIYTNQTGWTHQKKLHHNY